MAKYDARHGQGLFATLEGHLLDEAAHVTSSDSIGEAVAQLRLNVLPEDPVELPGAALLPFDLLNKVDFIELGNSSNPFGTLPLRPFFPCNILALLHVDKEIARLPSRIGQSKTRAMASNRDIQPFPLHPLAQNVCLDTTCADAQAKAVDDAVHELNLSCRWGLQPCDPRIRQPHFVRHMYLLP